MKTSLPVGHPYEGIDLVRLDEMYPSLLERGADFDAGRKEVPAQGMGLCTREKLLFRFGILSGLGEWEIAGGMLSSALESGLMSGREVERAAAECAYVMGMRASFHLGPILSSFGLHGTASPMEVLEMVRSLGDSANAGERMPSGGLDERELFALGLGVTWGAGCWDT